VRRDGTEADATRRPPAERADSVERAAGVDGGTGAG